MTNMKICGRSIQNAPNQWNAIDIMVLEKEQEDGL